jgi:hypothetical protein
MIYSKYNQLLLRAFLGGVILNFILPFTFNNSSLVTKEIFSIGNPALILFYTFLLLILFSLVSKKDIENRKKGIIKGIEIDKPKEITKKILRSVLEMVFGIVFMFLVPLIGGAMLFWSGLSIKLTVAVCIVYIAILVYLGKKYYWKDLYK